VSQQYAVNTCTTCLKMIGSSHTCHRWNESCPSELKWSVSSSRSSTLTTHVLLSMSQGLYYSYYKTIVEAPSLVSGVHLLLHDNTTEYPHTINTLKHFNLYPEVSCVFTGELSSVNDQVIQSSCYESTCIFIVTMSPVIT